MERYRAIMLGEKALMDRLQEPNLNSVERLLMKREYITKTRQGRVLTGDGIKRARELKEEMGL
jgi:Holliday junction resolvasome RuvABC ATP-dependent DNA helicase subunit